MKNLLNKKSFKSLNTKDLQQQQKHQKFILQIMEDELPKKFLATDTFYQEQKKIFNLISEVLNER
tara:strand:- start:917 stop:1111 length:195 start_codon:yes stop_codon:yes gene_type:complete